jgi:glutaredoxin
MQSRPPVTLPQVVLYSRPGCHLCEAMKTIVDRVRGAVPFDLTVIDISNDDALEERYGVEIPVLVINGQQVARYRVSEREFRQRLEP